MQMNKYMTIMEASASDRTHLAGVELLPQLAGSFLSSFSLAAQLLLTQRLVLTQLVPQLLSLFLRHCILFV